MNLVRAGSGKWFDGGDVDLSANQPGARAVLRHHGKSFHFAGRFLPHDDSDNCARLYRFCRYVDDLVDEGSKPGVAHRKVSDILIDLERGSSADPVVQDFLLLSREKGIPPEVPAQLCKGALQDLTLTRIGSQAELLRYCYRVAGTVGLMMSRVLGASDPRASAHAIDLGIGMQLTNIARDVMEDARRGRLYLPGKDFDSLRLAQIASGSPDARKPLRERVKQLLALAGDYYESGEKGLAYLPVRARLAILVAARVYRSIGREIASRDYAPWRGRAVVTTRKKILIGGKAVVAFAARRRFRGPAPAHDATLHKDLGGLIGTHSRESPEYVQEK